MQRISIRETIAGMALQATTIGKMLRQLHPQVTIPAGEHALLQTEITITPQTPYILSFRQTLVCMDSIIVN